MKILFLEASPKAKKSTSEFILRALESRLADETIEVEWTTARKTDAQAFAKALAGSDALVAAFPLYVDGIPAHLLALLEETRPLVQNNSSKTLVYAIANSGFYEAKQNTIALEMMKHWATKCGLGWGQGLAAGAGGMIQYAPPGHGPSKNLGKALDTFAHNIQNRKMKDTLFVEPNFPRFLYKSLAHGEWRKTAKKNGMHPRELLARPGEEA